MVVLTEGARVGAAIMSEANLHRSRENCPVGAETTILVNGLMGRKAVPADVTVTQAFAGTGNGVMTPASPAVSSKVKDGTYKIIFTAAASDAGSFKVEDPTGKEIGIGSVGVAFNKEIKFTIADGATDFVVGDTFDFIVAADSPGDFVYVAYDPAGTDGSEVPVGYSIYGAVTGEEETTETAGLVRECELNGNCIAWPEGITAAQKADALQALEARQIIVRF